MATKEQEVECLSRQAPIQLADKYVCNLGFYCPNNSDTHPPIYCPPTQECQIRRFQEFLNSCPQPQGVDEPIVCPPGSFCPSGSQIHPCPRGHYCPIGSVNPTPCMALSICPAGSEKEVQLLGLLCLLLVDAALIIAYCWRHMKSLRALSCTMRWKKPLEDTGVPLQPHTAASDTYSPTKTCWLTGLQPRGVEECRSPLPGNGIFIKFEGICLCLRQKDRPILTGISGEAHRGSLLGILGPSGSGKSSLVKILAGRGSATSGRVVYNGIQGHKSIYKYAIGFVPQDDIILPELTVYENVAHAAYVKLRGRQSSKALTQHVNELLCSLGLAHVQHSVVGNAEKRGISGGERKRVNIALELIGAPLALILDEPTSGLDSATALSLMKLIKSIALSGVTVICVLHQPRPDIFDLLDSILLLDSSQQVYSGMVSGVRSHFEAMGHRFHDGSDPNLADTILDTLSTLPQRSLRQPHQDPKRCSAGIRASWMHQVFCCLRRGILQQFRQPLTFGTEIIVGTSCGTIIGLAVYKYNGQLFHGIFRTPFEPLSSATNYGLVPELALLSCLAVTLAAAPASVETFGGEKHTIYREIESGHSCSAYFVGKDLSTIPRIILSSLHFTTFYAILATPLIPIGILFLGNTLYFYCMYGLAAAMSLMARRERSLLMAFLACLVVCMLNGYGPALIYVKEWNLQWLWFVCPGTWLAEAWVTEHTKPLHHLYDTQAAAEATGYTIGRTGFDLRQVYSSLEERIKRKGVN
ncbi:P-loop containing nucleoside triphosphate hydrolase protein [Aspergillus tamarii]|uniref:P-loop containing nucleoside triphosphate hydrolase protein n=1 Tax=Aspergillus tamarii TaxID=41984 RepID=A0A5N6UG10_ASPTM|nr:P-loop containing nucleoside triphosphate hydrolase protein [Aspergillus tamarii]